MKVKLFFALVLTASYSYGTISEKVLICGVCKNVEDRVPGTMKIMEKIGSLFSDYRIIVYENNSSDKTAELIKHWESRNSRVVAMTEFLSRNELEDVYINRHDNGDFFVPEGIARARNIVMDKAMSDAYEGFNYIIWMDMDFIVEPNYAGIAEAFQTHKEWDAVFAYGVDPDNIYWDWYAFRDARCPIGSELLGNDWWYLPKRLQLNYKDDWYPVLSAFGGCAIYKKSSVVGCRYSALVTHDLAVASKTAIENSQEHPITKKYYQDTKKLPLHTITAKAPHLSSITNLQTGIIVNETKSDLVWRMSSFVCNYPSVCEHVAFHASMIARGHTKLFINPRMKFRYGDTIKIQ